MANIYDIESYEFTGSDRLFIDTNVWIWIYGPHPMGQKNVRTYSRALSNIVNAKSMIYIDVLILSEFINRYARMEHKNSRFSHTDFKIYRRNIDFAKVAKDISIKVKKIINKCTRVDSCFTSLDIKGLIKDFSKGGRDFNDQIIYNICKENGLSLVTDDKDFKDFDLTSFEIITCNSRIFLS